MEWYEQVREIVEELGFTQCAVNYTMFLFDSEVSSTRIVCIIRFHIEDRMGTSNSPAFLLWVKQKIHQHLISRTWDPSQSSLASSLNMTAALVNYGCIKESISPICLKNMVFLIAIPCACHLTLTTLSVDPLMFMTHYPISPLSFTNWLGNYSISPSAHVPIYPSWSTHLHSTAPSPLTHTIQLQSDFFAICQGP